jgi:hypothetical protein
VGLANLGSESETCVGSRAHLVGVSISFEKNFYRLPFTPPSLVRRIGPSVYTLCRVFGPITIATSSDMDMSPDSFVLMIWDFYVSLIDESMVSRGYSWLEERGSIYLVDPIAIIEV